MQSNSKLSGDRLRILPDDSTTEAAEIASMPLVGAPHDENLTKHKFVAVGLVVMNGSNFIGKMRSNSMAQRAANALNSYIPNERGV